METYKILEINLISAQDLKPPTANLRHMQTYAVVWVDSTTKLRTRIDRIGGENPSWNDKFLFKVTPEFLSSLTSGVSFEIYAVGCFRDPLIGTVRCLISNIPLLPQDKETATAPSCIALQIRRPSGRFQGVLTVAAMVIDGSDFLTLNGASAIGYRDLIGESSRCRRRQRNLKKSVSMDEVGGNGNEGENSCGNLSSDGADSTTSSSSTASTALQDWNAVRDFTGNHLRSSSSDGGGLFCGLLKQRRLSMFLSAHDLSSIGGAQKEN